MSRPLNVVYIGNFGQHNTETHVARALEANGHRVERVQEDSRMAFPAAAAMIAGEMDGVGQVDFVLWTRTGWDWKHIYSDNHGTQLAHGDQRKMLATARKSGVPTVAFHLDRWFGLDREHQLSEEPFFECDHVITADGGNQPRFEELGINHHWMPPGVSLAECELGTPRDEFRSKLAFVGSWQGHYHQEHQHRFELVEWLQKNFRKDCRFYPERGQPAVRGKDLQDLYASVDVVVGDSCFAGSHRGNSYWSDRIPETVGRGGFLIHPYVSGLAHHFPIAEYDEPVTYDTGGLMTWQAGDWEELGETIQWALACPDERRDIALTGREYVMKYHTYEVRLRQMVELLESEGRL